MKIFTNKNIIQKLAIVLLIILIFSFIMSGHAEAIGGNKDDGGLGGKLLSPIVNLFVGLGDGIMMFIQKAIFHIDTSLIELDTNSSFLASAIVIVTAIAVVALAVCAIVASAGTAVVAIVAAAAKVAITITVAAAVTTITFPITTTLIENQLPDSFILPLYEVTPYEMFSNKINLFDVDFFNPKENTKKTIEKQEVIDNVDQDWLPPENVEKLGSSEEFFRLINGFIENMCDKIDKNDSYTLNSVHRSGPKYIDIKNNGFEGNYTYIYSWKDNGDKFSCALELTLQDSGNGIRIKYTAQKAKIVSTTIEDKSTAAELQSTISGWYVILRDISLVALLSILVYIGIRILISSTSSDKSKYKQMLLDWVVAICLLFVMQYIMSFSNIIVNKVIDAIDAVKVETKSENATEGNKEQIEIVQPEIYKISDPEYVKKAYEILVEDPLDKGEITSEESSPYYNYFPNGKDSKLFYWPAENFMQQARLNLQILDEDSNDTFISIGWALIFIMLVIYTILFMFTYIKRVIYMAFLTLIAPLVALTYPIDKINDGKAQAFNTWFREYIFNLLIQPMHLLLYMILIGSAMEFTSQNLVYVIVALGFMVPAEKLLRKFFGFEKAQTPGLFAGAAGGALMMSGMRWLTGRGPHGPKEHGANYNKAVSDVEEEVKPPKINNGFDTTSELIGDEDSSQNNEPEEERNIETPGIEEPAGLSDDELQEKARLQDYFDNTTNEDAYMNGAQYEANLNRLNQLEEKEKRQKELDEQLKNQQQNKNEQNQDSISRQLAQQTNNNDKVTPPPKRSIGRAIKSSGKYYARGVKDNIIRNLRAKGQNIHPLKTGVKLVGGAAGAATFAAGGLLAGMATGDASKTAQYIGALGAAGAKVGSGTANSVVGKFENTFGVSGTAEAARQAYYGSSDEYKKVEMEKYVKQMQKNKDNLLKLEMAGYKKDDIRTFMDNVVPTYAENGITEIDDMIATHQLEKNQLDGNRNMAIAIAKYGNRIGDTTKMSSKIFTEHTRTLERDFTPKLGEEEAKKRAQIRMQMVNQYHKYKNS